MIEETARHAGHLDTAREPGRRLNEGSASASRRPRRFYCGGDGNSVGVQYAELAEVGPAGLLVRR